MSKAERDGDKIKVAFSKGIPVDDETVLRYHPSIVPFITEIVREKGYKTRIGNVTGTAEVYVDLGEALFNLRYHSQGIVEEMRNGKQPPHYTLEARLDDADKVSVVKIKSIDSFQVHIYPKDHADGVGCDPLKKQITYLSPMLLAVLDHTVADAKIAKDRQIYEIAKWLKDEKGFGFESSWHQDQYKRLFDMFGSGKFKKKILMDITVEDESKFGNLESLTGDIRKLAGDKGALVRFDYKPKADDPAP